MSDLYQEHLVKKERTAADSAVRIAVIGFTALFVVAGLFITPFALLLAHGSWSGRVFYTVSKDRPGV